MKDPNVNPSGDDELLDTPSSLLERLKADDDTGWEQFVEIYSPLIVEWCKASGLQPADVQDVGQEVFRCVNGAIRDFRTDHSGGGFRAWLHTITLNKIRDLARLRANHPQAHGGSTATEMFLKMASEQPPPGASGESSDPKNGKDAAAREQQLVLSRAIEVILKKCEEKTRLAFTRVVLEGEDMEHVAKDLGMTYNALYVMKSRLLKQLRNELNGMVDLEG